MRFWVRDVPGDGNCLFEAVGRTVGRSAASLRKEAVELLGQPDTRLHGEPLSTWIPDVPIQAYAQTMSRSGTWGGGVELAMLSNLLQRPILVYASESHDLHRAHRIAEFLPDGDSKSFPICILYVGRAHYMQLVPKEE